MALQVLPPELTQEKDRIETKEPQPYWKPSSLKDGDEYILYITSNAGDRFVEPYKS